MNTMRRVKLSILIIVTGLVLSISACSKAQPSVTEANGEQAEVFDSAASSTIYGTGQNMQLPENSDTGQKLEEHAVQGDRQDPEENAIQGDRQDPEENAVQGTGQKPEESAIQGEEYQSAGSFWEREEVTGELEIHFLDVGEGDCTLLLCGGEAMLIDAGDNNQGTKIQNYLQKHGVETLKYVVCTHPDEDHIGGMDVILYKFDCETIFMTEEEKDTNTYRDVADTMNNRNYRRTQPVVGQQYTLGEAYFTILGPAEIGSDSNNNSIALLLVHGGNRFLFTGDAEEEEEENMLDSGFSLEADVYKAGHHGSRTSSSQKLLEVVSPAYVVISCGEDNSYGHPHAETMNNLRAMGVQVFRTDEQGGIVLISDGSEIHWNCSPSETWQSGEITGSSGSPVSGSATDTIVTKPSEEQTLPEPGTMSYICNTNTKKFHYPDCSSVKKMSDKNKLPIITTREELIDQGYAPCKICNP